MRLRTIRELITLGEMKDVKIRLNLDDLRENKDKENIKKKYEKVRNNKRKFLKLVRDYFAVLIKSKDEVSFILGNTCNTIELVEEGGDIKIHIEYKELDTLKLEELEYNPYEQLNYILKKVTDDLSFISCKKK